MMRYTRGSAVSLFLEGGVDFAHGCNCMCRMERGVALEVKKRLRPLMVADQRTKPFDRSKLGTFTKYNFGVPPVLHRNLGTGYNLYTQFHRTDASDMLSYPAIRRCFQRMFSDMEARGSKAVVIPRIGCGLAGGDWPRIEEIILDELPDGIDIVVVEYKPE